MLEEEEARLHKAAPVKVRVRGGKGLGLS